MTTSEKVAYLKGLAEGMGIQEDGGQGKLFHVIIDILEDLSLDLADTKDALVDLTDGVEEINEDLAELENEFYESPCSCCGGDDEDEEYDDEDEDDEFYLEDLIGFRVRIGTLKGEITDYYDSEANPLFEVEIGGKRILVPAVEEFIAGIDFESRTVKMVLPEGLIEL